MTTSSLIESLTVEAVCQTASIIPFPVRSKPAMPAPVPDERLARALESLSAALAEQRLAVAAWREVLGQLKTTTAGLSDSLQRYQSNLSTLGTSVSDLNQNAHLLEAWADNATTTGI